MTDSDFFRPNPEHPGVSPTNTPPDDATFVIWQDPSSYNPFFHGPPYLPGMKVRMDKSASMKTAHTIASKLAHGEGLGLPTALVFVRALAQIHQGHHWLTYGDTYYADHLLFERLYNETAEEADQIAEKAVGLGCPKDKLHPGLQASLIAKTVHMFCGDGLAQQEINPHVFMESSLKAEEHFISSLAAIAAEMKNHGELTRGADNLLAGVEDKHESHVYLLKQRLISDPWKV